MNATPQVRQTIYYIASAALAIVGLIQVWGGIDGGAAENLNEVINGLVTVLAGGAPALAGKTVSTQNKSGMFEQSLEPVVLGPLASKLLK